MFKASHMLMLVAGCMLSKRLALILYSVLVTSTLIATVIYSWVSLESMGSQLIEISIDRNTLAPCRVLAEAYSRVTYIYSDKLVYDLGETVHITLVTEFCMKVENQSFRVGDSPGSISLAVSKRTPTEGIIPPWTVWSSVIWEVDAETLNGTDVTLLLCDPSDDAIGTVVKTYSATVGQTVLNIPYASPGQRLVMNFTWDQTDFKGDQVQPGVYMLLGYLWPGWNRAQSNIFITQA